ncbi:MAG: hypothetical protein JWN31_891 [Frankiales bacterium]|nr:hypothetical protein [Frankiales bacterium]
MRKALALGTLSLAAAGAVLATPASALPLPGLGDTTVTFVAGTPGGLSILPPPLVVGVPLGNNVTGVMTSVVTDLRLAGGGWTDTVSSSNFNLVGALDPAGDSSIPASAVKMYTTSASVAIPGTATVSNVHTALDSALSLSNTGQELLHATTSNINVTTLLSTFSIDTTGKSLGAYSGTITQTVS